MAADPAPHLAAAVDADGLQTVLNQKLVVVGVARNCEASLPRTVQRLRDVLAKFESVHWLVVESDSSDRTVEVLQQLERSVPGFAYRSLGQLADRMPERSERLAHCRNAYLDQLRESPELSDARWVLAVDLDGVIDELTTDGLLSCFVRDDWAMCASNQRGPYYDIWALRHPHWCPGDCWAQSNFLEAFTGNAGSARRASIYERMITLPESSPWLEVESAFGGLAIYRASALRGVRYAGRQADGGTVCEHVPLHQGIREHGGRLFINPRFISADSTQLVEQYWPERAQVLKATHSPVFRLLLTLFFGSRGARQLRRLLQSLV